MGERWRERDPYKKFFQELEITPVFYHCTFESAKEISQHKCETNSFLFATFCVIKTQSTGLRCHKKIGPPNERERKSEWQRMSKQLLRIEELRLVFERGFAAE